MAQTKPKVQRTFDVAEFANKARQSLLKLKETQQPGQQSLGSKSAVVMAVKDDIKKLMDEGYTAKQIAEAFSSDVFGILPKSITELVEGKKKQTTKRQTNKQQTVSVQPADSKPQTNSQPTSSTKKQIGDAGSFAITKDSEDL